MKIDYKYQFEDYFVITKVLHKKSAPPKVIRYFVILAALANLCFFLFSLYLTLIENYSFNWFSIINLMAGLGLLYLFVYAKALLVRRGYRLAMLDNKEMSYETTNDGLKIQSGSVHMDVPWENIIDYDEEPDHFILWANKIQAHSIPKRAFEDAKQIRQFGDILKSNITSKD